MNQINSAKLLRSKWMAVRPENKEKHFLVVDVEFNEEGAVISCLLEAIISKSKLTQIEYGALVGATPSGVGKWLVRSDSKNHRSIPYSSWRLGLFELGYLSDKKA